MAQTKMNKSMAKLFSSVHVGLYKMSGGRIGGKMQGGQVIILGTIGRKTGEKRERPLIATEHPDGWVVIASFSGHDEHPAWYLNLKTDPSATVRIHGDSFDVRARETEGAERDELWEKMVEVYGDYDEYRKVTDRVIPVLVLERV